MCKPTVRLHAGDIGHGNSCARRIVGGNTIDTSQWPTPDDGALEGNRRALSFARKLAVELYLSGATWWPSKRRSPH
ncbi:hypothetical protein E6A55_20905 [Cupriavidus necator H16]|uniref:Uncharacterized protein n=1 Tax=Cupriavidus necator (strain ATCC 17699 / DSM 428 / KCTC 22496 / NCIMB 10442 / H16 / Stanier 337) TaxID=381666 RepID=A0AAE5ZL49_CUPNH|nr:hypothetical protein E6A55_20905 [Cupriavidus necator H16]